MQEIPDYIGRYNYEYEFYILEMGHINVDSKFKWFRNLYVVIVDFKLDTMQFKVDDEVVIVQ
eukprot:c46160_g1_i1 orf=113-298(+)